ncbi:MAG: hypothetical protein ACI8XO_001074 [Verrucomicrobiales bacterium]|jgi:hypothetical protein
MHALKRKGARALCCGAKVGRKTLIFRHRASINFGFWGEPKRLGVYCISREKANLDVQIMEMSGKPVVSLLSTSSS